MSVAGGYSYFEVHGVRLLVDDALSEMHFPGLM
jgi:hypothetical protein